MDGMSLLDVLRGVMLDPAEQAAYNANPGAYLEHYGYDDVDSADLSEAFGLVADTLPPEVAQTAWQASADHGDEAFGGVTTEFDTQAGVDAEPEPPPGADAPGAADDADPALSFGYGEADDQDLDGDASGAGLLAADASTTNGSHDGGAFGDAAVDDLADPDDAGTFGDLSTGDESGTGDVSGEDGDDAGDDAGPDGPAADDDGAGPGDGWDDLGDGQLDGGLEGDDGGLGIGELGDDSAEIDGLNDLAGLPDDSSDGTDIGSF